MEEGLWCRSYWFQMLPLSPIHRERRRPPQYRERPRGAEHEFLLHYKQFYTDDLMFLIR
jgi:hypothetical protein